MKLLWNQIAQSIAASLLIPGLLFSGGGTAVEKLPEKAPDAVPKSLTVPVLCDGEQVLQMDLEEYICRVVLGEMPATFGAEALKAQAVAARTYTLRCVQDGTKHTGGAVCTDYKCCQAYREPEEYIRSGGSLKSVEKVFSAVKATAGQVLYYDKELICATYFASSGGITEDAAEVWGQAYPYLVSVPSPGEQDTPYQGTRAVFTPEEFCDRLGVKLKGDPSVWFGRSRKTIGGGVDTIRIGGSLYSGLEIRKRFGLRSTIFTVSVEEGNVVFRTEGYGHRVGLSQYGADAMASAGHSYDEILSHYYGGIRPQTYAED